MAVHHTPRGHDMMPDPRIILVGEHAILMGAIAARLEYEHHCTVTDLAATPQQVAEMLATQPADILLMDIDGETTDWLESVAALRVACPSLRIICIGSAFEDRQINLLLEAGVNGFLAKDDLPVKIGTAIREVLNGGAYLPEDVRSRIIVEDGGVRLGSRPPTNMDP